jgi:uncharacterized protein YqjF (DUF2071 family)
MDLLEKTDHRPFPLPEGNWIAEQTWNDVLFIHWPVSKDVLRERIPKGLELDTYEGQAWVGITPFWLNGVRMRGLPPLPGVSQFPEVDVRTYVVAEDKPGVLYFTMDTSNPLIVAGARSVYFLPYFNAEITLEHEIDKVCFTSERQGNDTPDAQLSIRYWGEPDVNPPPKGTLDYWLTERYCLYTLDSENYLCRGNIHHLPWQLQPAKAEIRKNTLASAIHLPLPEIPPTLHFAKQTDVLFWPLERINL